MSKTENANKVREFLKDKSDLGELMMLIGLLTLIPVIVIPFYISEAKYIPAFLIPALASVAAGFIVCCLFKTKQKDEGYSHSLKHGSLIVLFAWFYAIIAGAVPFLFLDGINFIQALFESASGWTTTGFTVVDVAAMPHIFLFHRSFMQFCGGMGFVLMIVMVVQNKHSVNLYNLEGHNDQLTPGIIKTARMIFILYSSLFATGVILYVICGMPLFDGVIHSMSALSTGGFSNKAASVAAYDSVAVEAVTVLLMLLGMTNFAVLMLLTKRKFKQAAKVSELRLTGIILLISIAAVSMGLFLGLSAGLGESVRHAVFNVVSVLSTAGFSTVNYNTFPPFVLGIIVVIMFIGGGAGSTAGGIKIGRVYLLMRGAGLNIKKKLSPADRVISPHYYRAQGKTRIDDALIKDAYTFTFLYLLVFIVTSLLLCLTENISLSQSLFEAASLSATAGVSMGAFGPASSIATLIVGIIGMIIARLEINILIIGVYALFVRKE